METKNYTVAIWHEENGRGYSSQRWHGPNLNEAIMVASYEFVKKIIEAENQESKRKIGDRVDMSYAKKVKCRITVCEEIDPISEASGQLPKIIKSLGNEKIKIFKRVHFDE